MTCCVRRYWASKGPQMTLYVPGPVLREGENEVVMLELEGKEGGKDEGEPSSTPCTFMPPCLNAAWPIASLCWR